MQRPQPQYAVPFIPDWVPTKVMGRPVTNRGVHMLPFGFHYVWMRLAEDNIKKPTRPYWMNLFKQMQMSWVVIITESDSVIQKIGGKTPVEALLDNGIIPIIRDKIEYPGHFTNMHVVNETVKIYAKYGLRPPWIPGNEPLDPREWKHGIVPPYEEAMQIVTERWKEAANYIVPAGGVVGFPDGPGYDTNPFERLLSHRDMFLKGLAFYAAHTYGKGRPLDYPYDNVSHLGVPLTEEQYRAALDDYADDRRWYEEPLWMINEVRARNADPTLTALQDNVGFRAWEELLFWSNQTFGFNVAMAMTEGGWTPRDRAGSGPNTDIRWPHTTPKMVGKKTVKMFQGNSPFFAICPWLIADDAMQIHGYTGWPFDSWVGWAYSESYGYEKPVVEALIKAKSMSLHAWAASQCDNIMRV